MIKAIARTALIIGLACAGQAFGAVISLTLSPADGEVAGSAGQTVGWGFDITNDTSDYLVIDDSYFCEAGEDPVNGPDYACGPNLGASTYSDFIATYTGVIGPGETAQGFDGVSTGLGAYTIDPAALIGSTDSGKLVVVYDLYDSTFSNELAASQELTAAAVVDVVAPEPGTFVLFGAGLALTFALYRFHRARA